MTEASWVPTEPEELIRGGLVGREHELKVVAELVRGASEGRGGVLAIRGAAGAGKTAMLDHIEAAAPEIAPGALVVRASGLETESDLAFAALFDLVRPLADALEFLADHQRLVLQGAVGLGPPQQADRFAIGAALLELLSAASIARPLVLIVDDVQWFDGASRDALVFAARRLRRERVAVLLGVRMRSPLPSSVFDEILLAPLSRAEAADLLRRSCSVRVAPAVEREVVAVAAGSPLALVELPRMLSPDQLSGREPLPDPLPVGRHLAEVFERQLDSLPPGGEQLLLLVATSTTHAADPILRAMRRAGHDPAALEAVERQELVAVVDGSMRLRHPLLRSVVVQRAHAADRRAAHQALADALDADDDLDRRTWHLAEAAAGPSAETASLLEDAADRAAARGAMGEAARAMERSARLTPTGELWARRLGRAGEISFLAGQSADALRLAEEALGVATAADLRGGLQHLRGRVLLLTGASLEAFTTLTAAAPDVEARHPQLAAAMLVDAALPALLGRQPEIAAEVAARACRLAEPGTLVGEMAELAAGAARIASGDTQQARLVVERSRLVLDQADDLLSVQVTLHTTALVLIWAERYDDAARLTARIMESARRRGALGILPFGLANRAVLEYRVGEWQLAEASAMEAAELAEQAGQATIAAYALQTAALVVAQRGEPDRALQLLDEAADVVRRAGARLLGDQAVSVRGVLALSLGRFDDAVAELSPLAQQGPGPTPGVLLWLSDLVEALALLGRRDEAVGALRGFGEAAERTGNRRERAATLRCEGLLLADYDARFQEALGLLSTPPLPPSQARTLLVWGERLAREGRHDDARRRLHEAAALFQRLDARSWLQRVDRARAGIDVGEASVGAGAAVVEVAGSDDVAEPEAPTGRPVTAISVLGRFLVTRGEEDITPPPGLAATVVKLVAIRGAAVHLDELIEALWPESDPDRGRIRLRNVLARVRRASGDVVVRRGDTVALGDDVEVDALRFAQEADGALALKGTDPARAEELAQAALAHARGTLLPDSLYESWSTAARERTRRRELSVLELLAELALARGDAARAAEWYLRIADADPLDEHRCARAAEALLDAGNPNGAADLLDRADAAATELGVPPSALTLTLRSRLAPER